MAREARCAHRRHFAAPAATRHYHRGNDAVHCGALLGLAVAGILLEIEILGHSRRHAA